jgi:hypothetical protein
VQAMQEIQYSKVMISIALKYFLQRLREFELVCRLATMKYIQKAGYAVLKLARKMLEQLPKQTCIPCSKPN